MKGTAAVNLVNLRETVADKKVNWGNKNSEVSQTKKKQNSTKKKTNAVNEKRKKKQKHMDEKEYRNEILAEIYIWTHGKWILKSINEGETINISEADEDVEA